MVTVTYSPGETLEKFLDSVAKATSRPVRVLLADNGSTDGAPERAAQRDGVSLLRIGENVGYGTAAKPGPLTATVQAAIDVWSSHGKLRAKVSPSDLINYSFVNE